MFKRPQCEGGYFKDKALEPCQVCKEGKLDFYSYTPIGQMECRLCRWPNSVRVVIEAVDPEKAWKEMKLDDDFKKALLLPQKFFVVKKTKTPDPVLDNNKDIF